MSQTILIEPNLDLKKLFSINLNTYTGTDVIDRETVDNAIELLRILPTIDLIICRNTFNNEASALKMFNYLKENDLTIPFIVLGEEKKLTGKVIQMKEPISWEALVKKASNLLGVTQEQIRLRVRPEHTPIPLHYFYDIDHTPCDVFIRIQRAPSDYQFVKRLHAQDSFTAEDIDKYKRQGLKFFYVTKDYQQYFATFLTNSIINKLEENLDIMSRLETNSNAYDIVKEHLHTAGVTEEMSDLTKSTINSLLIAVQEAPPLADLLKMLFSSKISYAYQKAHLVCVIGNFILTKQKWFKDKHLKLLTYASFFADISLKSNSQMRVNSESELKTSVLNKEEKAEVIGHAQKATLIVKDFKIHNEDLATVLTQHHGSPSGLNFASSELSEVQTSELHPVAKIFMIADSFVKLMLDPNAPKSKREILAILYMQYPDEELQALIKRLEQDTK